MKKINFANEKPFLYPAFMATILKWASSWCIHEQSIWQARILQILQRRSEPRIRVNRH
jgi:hypothetical protein